MTTQPQTFKRNGVLYEEDPTTVDPLEAFFKYNIGSTRKVMRLMYERIRALEEKNG